MLLIYSCNKHDYNYLHHTFFTGVPYCLNLQRQIKTTAEFLARIWNRKLNEKHKTKLNAGIHSCGIFYSIGIEKVCEIKKLNELTQKPKMKIRI